MARPVTWFDRLRIERVVWLLDHRLYELPRRTRIATRREVRGNLLSASRDVGTTEALRNLGTTRQLAAEYRTAELGTGPRASWMVAGLFLLTGQLVLTALLGEAANAFGHGITAADPHATGTFRWSGVRWLQDDVTYTYVDGRGDHVGGAWTPLAWVLWLGATVVVGRLWWALPALRRRAAASALA